MPTSSKRYRMSSRQSVALSCVYIATVIPFVTANVNFPQAATGQRLQRSRGTETGLFHQPRREQIDPCDLLLDDVNTCLPSANPTCGTCVSTAFDMFLSSTNTNFTCADFEGGVCPIIFQQCLCAPCNTELASYFNCVLNDVSDNTCPVAYCDPLKDFSITPDACVDDLAFASACIGSDCLQCLSETINFGEACESYEESVCDAVNIDCLSCLECYDVVEPWLRCLAVESMSCATFQCDSNVSPAAAPSQPSVPSMVLAPGATTFPTSVPVMLTVDTPLATTPTAPMADGPTPDAPTTRDVPSTSMAAVTSFSMVYTATLVGLWLGDVF